MIRASASVAIDQRKMRADAHPRADAERQIGETIRRQAPATGSALEQTRSDRARVFRADAIAMARSGSRHVFLIGISSDDVGSARRARNQKCRRIIAAWFSSTTARVNFNRSRSASPSADTLPGFVGQLLLCDRIERQQIQRPEQRRGGGFVAGENHGRDLVAKLGLAEGLAGYPDRAPRSSDRTGRAPARPPAFPGRAAFRHQHADELRPPLAEARPRKIPAGPASYAGNTRSKKCGRASRSAYSMTKSRKGRAVTLHPERKHRADRRSRASSAA